MKTINLLLSNTPNGKPQNYLKFSLDENSKNLTSMPLFYPMWDERGRHPIIFISILYQKELLSQTKIQTENP